MEKSTQDITLPGRKGLTITVILMLLLSLQTRVFGRADDPPAKTEEKKTEKKHGPILKEWLKEEKTIWTSPNKMVKREFFIIGGVSLAAAFLIRSDKYLHREISDFSANHKLVNDSSPVITKLGSVRLNIGILSAFYLGGVIFKNDRAKDTARLSFKSLLHGYVVSQVLKRLFRRQRPYVEDGVDHWFNRGSGTQYRSFPSGHSTAAWSVATVVAWKYKHKKVVPVICYSLATLVSLSRMTENKHWASDVVVGALLGYSIGRFVIRKQIKRLKIMPVVEPNRLGLNLTYVF
jgi:membrane-associated phospholipid phosphatase